MLVVERKEMALAKRFVADSAGADFRVRERIEDLGTALSFECDRARMAADVAGTVHHRGEGDLVLSGQADLAEFVEFHLSTVGNSLVTTSRVRAAGCGGGCPAAFLVVSERVGQGTVSGVCVFYRVFVSGAGFFYS